MRSFRLAFFAATSALLAFVPMSAHAVPYVTGYIGQFDVLDGDSRTQFGAEYRFNQMDYGVVPLVGANIDTDGAGYIYAGFNWEVPLIKDQLFIIPNFAVGAYGEGDGKDLGGAIQFRSGLELAYQFPAKQRVGVAFNHISNASIYDKNPGAETLLVNFSVPTGFLAK